MRRTKPRSANRFSYRCFRSAGSPAMARSMGVGRLTMTAPACVDEDTSSAVDADELQAVNGVGLMGGGLTGETKVG